MVADERSIVCGLGDGRVDVYHRASLTRYRCSIHFLDFLIYLQAVQDKTHPPPTCKRSSKFFSACVLQLFSFLNWKFFKNAQFSWTLCIWIWDRPYNWPLTSLYLSFPSLILPWRGSTYKGPAASLPLYVHQMFRSHLQYSGLVHTAFLTLLAKPSFFMMQTDVVIWPHGLHHISQHGFQVNNRTSIQSFIHSFSVGSVTSLPTRMSVYFGWFGRFVGWSVWL